MSFNDFLKNDLDVFLNDEEFAEEVTYHLGATSSKLIVQYFDEESDMGDSIFRKIIAKAESLPDISTDGFFLISGEKYGIIDYIVDEQGLTLNIITQKGM